MHRNVFRILAVAGIASVAAAMPAVASANDDSVTTHADVDGDGSQDQITLTIASDNTQRLEVVTAGGTAQADLPGSASTGVRLPRIVDVNGDEKKEIVVTESIGANTLTYSVWDYRDSTLHEMSTPDGQPLKLNEGGGMAAHTGYECASGWPTGRDLIVLAVSNESQTTEPSYDGKRVRYHVENGIATTVDTYPINGAAANDPALKTKPETCG